jgi:hypothetical protein
VQLRVRNVPQVKLELHPLDLDAYFRKFLELRGVESLDLDLIAPAKTMTVAIDGFTRLKEIVQDVAIETTGPGAWVVAAVGGDQRAIALLEERARLVGRAAAILLDLFDPDLLTVVEAGEQLLPQCRALLRAELAAGSTAGAGSGQVVAGTSFPDHVLATAGGAVILDRIYASPTAVPGRFSRAS